MTPCLHVLCLYCIDQLRQSSSTPHCPVCKSEIKYCISHDTYPPNSIQTLLDIKTFTIIEPIDHLTFYYIWNPAKPFSIPRTQLHTCCLCHKPNRIAYQLSCCNAEYCSHCSQIDTRHQYLICPICSYCPTFIYIYYHHPRKAYIIVTNTSTPQFYPTRLFYREQQTSAQIEFPINRFSPTTTPLSLEVSNNPYFQTNILSLLQQPPFIPTSYYQATQIDNPFPELPLMSVPTIIYSPPLP